MNSKFFLTLLLLPSLALAESAPIRNDTPTQLRDLGSNLQVGRNFAVDRFGITLIKAIDPNNGLVQSVIPLSQGATPITGVGSGMFGFRRRGNDTVETGSTTTVINATSHVAIVGNIIYIQDGNASESTSVVTAVTANTITVSPALRATPANGDNFIIGGGTPLATTSNAVLAGLPILQTAIARGDGAGANGAATGAGFLLKDEDSAFSPGDAHATVGGQALSAIAQSVGTTGDLAPFAMDLGNRLVTTNAPSGSLYRGCNTAVTTATTGTILAAVASNFTYLTAVSCTNSGAAASFITIEDGGGSDIAVGYLAATAGTEKFTFPIVPGRTSTTNQAIQVNVATTNTSTVCCAIGYTGVI
jgi:hypothetical protein